MDSSGKIKEASPTVDEISQLFGKIKEAALTLDGITQLLLLLTAVLIFIALLGRDTWKAIKKRAHWIPGDWLVLSALTIQILNLLNGESSLLKNILDNPKPWNGEILKNNLYMIHSSRVMLCVLVAYLLPGMARPGYEDSWGKLGALVLSIFLHISSELFTVHRRLADSDSPLPSGYAYDRPNAKRVTEGSFIISGVIISISLVWLILLLSCATMANKSIRVIVCQRIPIILAKKSDGGENSWQAVEDQVLKSWIVARACYPESIIAKSVLSSSAALAVTLCVLCSVGGWLVQGPIIKGFAGAQFWLKFVAFILELVFIVIGWAIIGWRCITSVTYYRTWERKLENTWRNFFQVEDFWTRYIVEQQEEIANESKKDKRKIDERVSKMVVEEGTEIGLSRRLLQCVFFLQLFVVYFSKGCWFFSDLILNNRLMQKLSSMLLSKHEEKLEKDISEYREILANVNFLQETPRTVFVSNQKSIKQARDLIKEGNMDGQNCKTLISFLAEYRKSDVCVGIVSATSQYQTGLRFLWKRDLGAAALDVEKHFMCARKPSCKLTAVSLINIIVRLSPSRGADALKAYSEACEVINLVEDDEPETDSFLSKAADNLFKTLQEQSAENAPSNSSQDTTVASMEQAAAAIDEIAEESKRNAEIIGRGQDSLDWKKVAAGNALYKLCKSIDCGSSTNNVEELVNELKSALADIIVSCIEKVGAALVESCKKWAIDLQERKLLKAVYIAGKARGLMEQLESCPSLQNGSSTPQALQ